MQVLAGPQPVRPSRVLPSVVAGVVVGLVLLAGGALLGYLTLGTTFLERFTPTGRATETQMVAGVIAWSFGLTAPALFVIVGAVRLFSVAELLSSLRPEKPALVRLAGALPDDYVAATRLQLPDGRWIPQLVLGPFGVAVVEALPPAGMVRRHGSSWEVRRPKGGWMPFENPLDRAARDAESVRRWFGHEDRDFVVKLYAAVLSADPTLERTPACAVVAPDKIGAWLASLPPQRSLTASRRDALMELLRSAL